MNKLVVASMERSAGKTSVIVGIARALGQSFGYMKPFGERLVYLKKRVWDYDAALMTKLFGLSESPEDMTIGFGQSKLRYMYDEEARRARLSEMASKIGRGRELLLVEGGAGLRHGGSVGLDPVSVATQLDAKLVVVASGNEDAVMDDIHFLKRRIDLGGVRFGGVVINKVRSTGDFREACLDEIRALGVPVLGIVPFEKELTYISVGLLAERLFAKVVTGGEGMGRLIKNIFVGAMSADPAHRNALINIINKESKLIITSGDRSDMILAALESDTSCILLTNNILPPSSIISKASDRGVTMLLVPQDTYTVTAQIDDIEPLLSREDRPRVELVERLMREHLNLAELTRF
ncbi:MAG: DRTGG domain-containing protein [Thermoplasmatota archaeon]